MPGVGSDIASTFGLNVAGHKPLITEVKPVAAKPQISEVSTQRKPKDTELKTEPFLPWMESTAAAAEPLIQPAAEPTDANVRKQSSAAGCPAQPDFEAASTFTAAKPGFLFKLGGYGLGYYRDGSEASQMTPATTTSGIKPPVCMTAAAIGDVAKKMLSYELNRDGNKIIVSVHLPGRRDSKGVVLAVMGTAAYSDFTLRAEGFEELRVRLPTVVNQQNVKAKFSKASQRLAVHLDVVPAGSKSKDHRRHSGSRRKKSSMKQQQQQQQQQAPPKEKVDIDDLKICSQCGGLGQYTDAQDVKCGLQGQRNSGLQRVLTYECPSCEGEGYVNRRTKQSKGTNGDEYQAEASGWEMVDAGTSKDAGLSKEDQAKYSDFKNNMDPKKREEFERVLREARGSEH